MREIEAIPQTHLRTVGKFFKAQTFAFAAGSFELLRMDSLSLQTAQTARAANGSSDLIMLLVHIHNGAKDNSVNLGKVVDHCPENAKQDLGTIDAKVRHLRRGWIGFPPNNQRAADSNHHGTSLHLLKLPLCIFRFHSAIFCAKWLSCR
jgi:hypothetical protein